jgi:hypothetical protein
MVRKLVSVARDAKEMHLQRPRASISKPSSLAPSNGTARRSSSGNDEDLDLDFVAEPALLNTAGYGKAKGSASADGASVIQQPLHRAIMEHRPSLSANVSPSPLHPAHSPNALSRAFANTMGRARPLEARTEFRLASRRGPRTHRCLGVRYGVANSEGAWSEPIPQPCEPHSSGTPARTTSSCISGSAAVSGSPSCYPPNSPTSLHGSHCWLSRARHRHCPA